MPDYACDRAEMNREYEDPASWMQEELEQTMTDSATWTSMLGSIEAHSEVDDRLSRKSTIHPRSLWVVRLVLTCICALH